VPSHEFFPGSDAFLGDQVRGDSHLIENEKLSFSVKESKAEREKVYKIGDGKLGFQYAFDSMPLVKQRLVQAGVRLAGLLSSLKYGD